MPLLELKSVSVGYGRNPVLQNVDLTLERGEIVTLLVANGAGKSTLVKSISGLLRPEAGSILLDGEPIETLAPAERLRRGIAHVPEGRQIFAGMTVEEIAQVQGKSPRTVKWKYADPSRHISTQSVGTGH